MAHASLVLDRYLYGFALQQTSLPFQSAEEAVAVAGSIFEPFSVDAYPYFAELAVEHALKPGCDYGDEFEFGLDLILDGLEGVRDRASQSPSNRNSTAISKGDVSYWIAPAGWPTGKRRCGAMEYAVTGRSLPRSGSEESCLG